MKNTIKPIGIIAIAIALFVSSCSKKNDTGTTPGGGTNTNTTPTTTDTSSLRGSAGGIYIGFALNYNLMTNGTAFASTAFGQVNQCTFGNEMKYASIVQNNGALNFATADAFLALCTSNNIQVYGHCLCWHSQQNTSYLNTLLSGITPVGNNLALNGSFESGLSTNWFTQVSNTAPTAGAITLDNTTAQSGTNSMKVVVTTPGPSTFSIQAVNDAFAGASAAGQTYQVSFWAKGAGSVILVLQGAVYDGATSFTTTSSWAQYTATVTLLSGETAPQVRFNFATAGTYNIDNVQVFATISGTLPHAQQVANIDNALNAYVTGMATHYAGKVKAWDVVNEIMNDGASGLRTSSNTNSGQQLGAAGIFYWTDYLGRNTAVKAFNYAHAADPNALLFINDYNLEYSSVKLDSLIAYVKYIQNSGAHIDGIGTQMHMNLSTSTAGIDAMFQKLAATGLKVRISEMDVSLNSSQVAGFVPTAAQLTQQATLYHYAINSFKTNVPKAQQYGITIWGVDDTDSWLYSTAHPDFPLLYDGSYNKKAAYTSALQALRGQ